MALVWKVDLVYNSLDCEFSFGTLNSPSVLSFLKFYITYNIILIHLLHTQKNHWGTSLLLFLSVMTWRSNVGEKLTCATLIVRIDYC